MSEELSPWEADQEWFKARCREIGIVPTDDLVYEFAERVSIMHFDGGFDLGMSRQDAFDLVVP